MTWIYVYLAIVVAHCTADMLYTRPKWRALGLKLNMKDVVGFTALALIWPVVWGAMLHNAYRRYSR